MVIADEGSLPVAISVASASPHEVTLVEETLAKKFVSTNPDRLVADRAYDSDPLDALLLKQGIVLIAPHRSNRKKSRTQDGRSLRSYKRRWKIERTNAWLQNWRKLVTRYEYLLENFLGMIKLVCIMLLFRRYF